VPISVGAIQTVLDRVAQAIEPYDVAIATQVRHTAVNYLDATPWFLVPRLPWLWGMVSDTAALSMMHPQRSTDACAALIDDWAGILVSDGDGVYQRWVHARQTCLAHRIRRARGVAARAYPAVGAGGPRAMAELQRLGHRAQAPPTGGEWRAWYARLCQRSEPSHDRQADAGRCARRLLRELDSLWVLLAQHGVEPTNKRAE